MKSIGEKVQQLATLAGTSDVSVWESGFITSIVKATKNGNVTTALTERQVEMIGRIHDKHFA